ncbi:hypothetical protein F4859DRAFT_474669, partial [Xylaria cf. heliscus]
MFTKIVNILSTLLRIIVLLYKRIWAFFMNLHSRCYIHKEECVALASISSMKFTAMNTLVLISAVLLDVFYRSLLANLVD